MYRFQMYPKYQRKRKFQMSKKNMALVSVSSWVASVVIIELKNKPGITRSKAVAYN